MANVTPSLAHTEPLQEPCGCLEHRRTVVFVLMELLGEVSLHSTAQGAHALIAAALGAKRHLFSQRLTLTC